MDEYKKYLADQILSEEKIVTYRSLSRALKVHVNTAKGMLYDFHRSQNGMRPGTIHATYLIYGTPAAQQKVQDDGDVEMATSPPDVETSEDVVTHSLSLVPGDLLKDTLATYEEVTSFHIYSLARHPTRDMQLLADVHQQIKEQSTNESATTAAIYGTITNPNVRKRTRQGRGPVPTPAAPAPAAKPVKKEAAPPAVAPEPKAEIPVKQEANTQTRETPASTAATKKGAAPPALKKSGSSGISGMFAKAAAKAASKPKEAPKPAPVETPALSDDGEDDDEDIPAAKAPVNSGRKSRKDREAELKMMMEESEEEEEEEPEEKEEDEPMDEPMEEAPEPEAKPEPAEVVSSTGDGRRRGKRRVMKKKQIMDDQGYLVTIQEPAWEEFSEDEAPPPPAKVAKTSSAPSSGSQAAKPKKPAPKGQGNIMSFFSKK